MMFVGSAMFEPCFALLYMRDAVRGYLMTQ